MSLRTLSKPYSLESRFSSFFLSTNAIPVDESHAFHESIESPNPAASAAEPKPTESRPMRRRRPPIEEKIENVICRMMSSRAWTTRLQNSIRSLVPSFDHSLVYNVIHGARQADHALQFFRWVERSGLFKHDRETNALIIQILGRASKLNHARCILLDMPKKGVDWDEEMFVYLIEAYGKAGIVQESVKLFNKMGEVGIKRTGKSYDTVLKVILRRGRYMMAKRIYNKMINEGIEPTRHTYNILLWGMFLSLRLDSATRYYEEMKQRGISPDVVTYNTMIYGYHRLKKWDEAEHLFTEMKAKNIPPTAISYTTMLKGYITSEKLDEAWALLAEMKSFGLKPTKATYSTLLPGLCSGGKLEESKTLLNEMVARHVPPTDTSVFARLISGYCLAGDPNSAADVLKSMNRLNVKPDASHYGMVIENYCKAGEYGKALILLDNLLEKNIILNPQSESTMEPTAYTTVIHYLCNNGGTKKAEIFFRQLMKVGVKNAQAFNDLIRGHAKEACPEAGYEIMKIMARQKVPREADSYSMLIESYLRKGEPAEAKTALDGMVEDGHVPDALVLKSVMQALVNEGRVQTASRVMKTMVEKGVKGNPNLMMKIIEGLFVRGHVEEALGRVEMVMVNGYKVDVDAILGALVEEKKGVSGYKLVSYALERGLKFDFGKVGGVLDALLAEGKTIVAFSLLCKVKDVGAGADWVNIDGLIKTLNEEGHTDQADVLARLLPRRR